MSRQARHVHYSVLVFWFGMGGLVVAIVGNVLTTDNFIPFSEYDSRRVNTLKLEQNDFLALPARLQSQSQEKKKRHFSQS